MLSKLDVPFVAAHPVEFQTLDNWGGSDRGLMPVESTIMVAIPELDGSTGPIVFGGRPGAPGVTCSGCQHACTFTAAGVQGRDMTSCPERAQTLAARVDKLVALRRGERAQRKVAVVIFNFPPNAGNIGSAAYLSVFESLFHTLAGMRDRGYAVQMPDSIDALREAVLKGNAERYGADANVHTVISANDHVKRETWLKEIEAQWGPAPGKQLSNGSGIFVLGRQFGNVLVAVAAFVRLRRRPDAAAVRKRPGTHACLLGLLPLPARRLRAPPPCCISAPTAHWNSCRANKAACRATAGPTA